MSFWQTLVDIISYPIRLLASVPMAVVSGPRKLLGLPLPVRVALMTVFVLLISAIAIIEITKRYHGGTDPSAQNYKYYIVLPMILVIGIVVYYAVKLWLTGNQSPFPDIDQAWQQGLKALAAQGIDVNNIPIFLVIGVGDDRNERHLLQASGMPFRVRDVPTGPGPLHFYASDNAAFVVCTQTSRLSRFVSNPIVDGSSGAAGGTVVGAGGGGANLRSTMVAGGGESRPTENAPDLRGTISQAGGGARPQPSGNASGNVDLRGTMEARGLRDSYVPASSAQSSVSKSSKMSNVEFSEHGQRLQYLCYLLRQARQPYCPINGIMCVLPFRLIQKGTMEANEIQRAMREDLATIRQSTKLRCPVVVMISGMDSESGFMELIRRVGIDRARVQRFGKGYGVWNPPTDQQMRAVADHACGAFEDTVYQLFKEKDGYNKPGNGKLYQLLCKVRNEVRGRLASILAQGLGFNPKESRSPHDVLLMGGCYFAATGETEDLQAFVRSVFEKFTVDELDSELDWAPEAIREDQRYQNLARLCYLVSAGLSIAVAVLLVMLIANR